MANVLEEIKEEAQELIASGDAIMKCRGLGMMKAINVLGKYYLGFQEYDEYFDSISDEQKPLLNAKLKKLEIY